MLLEHVVLLNVVILLGVLSLNSVVEVTLSSDETKQQSQQSKKKCKTLKTVTILPLQFNIFPFYFIFHCKMEHIPGHPAWVALSLSYFFHPWIISIYLSITSPEKAPLLNCNFMCLLCTFAIFSATVHLYIANKLNLFLCVAGLVVNPLVWSQS